MANWMRFWVKRSWINWGTNATLPTINEANHEKARWPMNRARSKKWVSVTITERKSPVEVLLAHVYFFFTLAQQPYWAKSSLSRMNDHTQRRTTVGRTPLDEWSAPRRDLYLTTHNTHNRQTSMPPAGFEPTISAGERPQTYALDRAATGTGIFL